MDASLTLQTVILNVRDNGLRAARKAWGARSIFCNQGSRTVFDSNGQRYEATVDDILADDWYFIPDVKPGVYTHKRVFIMVPDTEFPSHYLALGGRLVQLTPGIPLSADRPLYRQIELKDTQ